MSNGSPPAISQRRERDAQVVAYVARRVRDLRLQRAVTQEELATTLGVRRESMSRYESGERAITIPMLLDIAEILGHPISDFLPSEHAGDPCPAPMAAIIATLRERPDLISSVQDLLDTMREDSDR